MKHNRITLILAFFLLLISVACGGAASMESVEAPSAAPAFRGDSAAEEAMDFESADDGSFVMGETAANDNIPAAQERLIIRTGNLSLVVADTEGTMADITSLVEGSGGWVVNSSLFQSGNAKRGEMTVRVPAEGFNSAIDTIKAMALEVTSESTSGEDVTEEYVDLSARLDNLEATAERVRGFLDEARDVEDALAVNQELSRLEEQIEMIKGRMQFLSQSAAFSTIHINLTPDELAQPIEVGGWRPQGVAKNAIEALIDALQVLANFLIWFVIFILPLLLIVIVPIWLLIRFVRRRRRRRKAETAVSPAPPQSETQPEEEA